ncbi:MAG: NAD-binding protein [Akkermansiaceae bacterium]|nr:NAD-binding protein [Akkermansiaceae bacterium]
MKSLFTVLITLHQDRRSRTNMMVLVRMLGLLAAIVTVFAVIFHMVMESEEQRHSWITGFYWTLTVMTTLGFGDITFHSDLGRAFSIVVMVTGVLYLLVLLPFTFIEFFYAPWIKAQESARAPRQLPPNTRGHVIITRYDTMTEILLQMLADHGYPAWVLCPVLADALELRERGVAALTGDPNDCETWDHLRIGQAAMLVANGSDIANTNVTFTVRGVSETLPIVATASSDAARDALELAGVSHILRTEEMMGGALARRVIGDDAAAHVVGNLNELVVAEACATGTPLVGQTLAESRLRSLTGVTVVGTWEQGQLIPCGPETLIGQHSLFLVAGSQEQIDEYNKLLGQYQVEKAKIIIVGGGLVGRATARALDERGVEWTLIERSPVRAGKDPRTLLGDASEFETLVKAGLHEAPSVIITTHNDETNLFLTIFFRRLRRTLQIICRCSQEGNVAKLHRAGANLVLSYASMTANTVFNHLSSNDTLLLAEGVNLFPTVVPAALAGQRIGETTVRELTGCSILAVETEGERILNPDPEVVLPESGSMILIGSLQAEQRFNAHYHPH